MLLYYVYDVQLSINNQGDRDVAARTARAVSAAAIDRPILFE